jgi:uncharacterized SAM-binding protein YcdF (DUF218 family)
VPIFLPALLCLLVAVILMLWDPRRLSVGIFLLAALVLAGLPASGILLRTLLGGRLSSTQSTWTLLVVIAVLLAFTVTLGVLLVVNGVMVVKREGRTLANLLSLLLGAGILGYTLAACLTMFTTNLYPFLTLLLLAFPLGYLGFGLVAMLLWSWLYGVWARHRRRAPESVVVLGAGVPDGRVRPLLASRLDGALRIWNRWTGAGASPLLVASGGQGADEPDTEAAVMGRYLVAAGLPPECLRLEERSTTTQENLRYTRRLLEDAQAASWSVVVTNSFHAFRAATLMRREGLPGVAIGTPTAHYFWPSAMLREYVAMLRDSLWLNAFGLILSCLPLAAMLVGWTLS